MFNDERTDFDRFTWGIVRRKARQLVGHKRFRQQDEPDIQQHLLLHIAQRAPAFDARRGHANVFVTTLVERAVANMVRDSRAEKRDPARVCSLNAHMAHDDVRSGELAETIGDREYDARRECHSRSEQEQAELANDVHAVIAALPDQLRQLASKLESMTVAEIARETGMARSTINDRISELRRRFEKAGLQAYL